MVVAAALLLAFDEDGDVTAPARQGGGPGVRTAPAVELARIGAQGDVVMAGRADANDTVVAFEGEREIGRARTDGRGEWVLLPVAALGQGEHHLAVRSGAGTVKGDRLALLIPPPHRQTNALAVRFDRVDGRSTILHGATLAGTGGHDLGQALTIASIDYGPALGLDIAGRAAPLAQVAVYRGDVLLGRIGADRNGAWRLHRTEAPTSGTLRLRAEQIGADGRVEDRAEVVMGGDNAATMLWRIKHMAAGGGQVSTEIHRPEREQRRDPGPVGKTPAGPDRHGIKQEASPP